MRDQEIPCGTVIGKRGGAQPVDEAWSG